MKKSRKLVALTLTVVLGLSALTGCGKKETNTQKEV